VRSTQTLPVTLANTALPRSPSRKPRFPATVFHISGHRSAALPRNRTKHNFQRSVRAASRRKHNRKRHSGEQWCQSHFNFARAWSRFNPGALVANPSSPVFGTVSSREHEVAERTLTNSGGTAVHNLASDCHWERVHSDRGRPANYIECGDKALLHRFSFSGQSGKCHGKLCYLSTATNANLTLPASETVSTPGL
jgi:hypothetical protein